jgi:pyruvate dehydrogenase (NADP+)
MIKIHLYRPWDAETFLKLLPKNVKKLAVLDRTKEQTSLGEPLFLDVCATLQTVGNSIKVIGGRYGLGSKEFTPAMARAVFDNLKQPNPLQSFSVGIEDDVTHKSIKVGPEPDVSAPGTRQCLFWGMGSDGTVSANKNAIKLIADHTDLNVQAYFAYDSKKAGGCTISHMRFGPSEIDAPYAIQKADYIAVSQRTWPHKFPNVMLETLADGGSVVFNSASKSAADFEAEMPQAILNEIGRKHANVYTIDANKVARENGLGRHTNNVLAAVFFKLSGVLPYDEAEKLLKQSMRKAYAAKGEELVNRNLKAVDAAIENLVKIEAPFAKWESFSKIEPVDPTRPEFCTKIMDPLNALEGNALPVSAFNPRGHYPPATTQYEKRGIALTVPIVDMDKCTQCNKCSMICPHAAIRPFLISQLEMDQAPKEFDMRVAKGGNDVAGMMFRIQVAPEDCTGCEACSWACPDDALTMTPLPDVIETERANWSFAANLPNRGYMVDKNTLKGSQFQKPLLEFSGACEGCGETPYAKLVTQLFGERMVIANASGCSSVWAGTAAFNPLAVNADGQGPAWGRSLFEDAAEYGLGMARAIQTRRENLAMKLEELVSDEDYKPLLSVELAQSINEWLAKKDDPIASQELYKLIPAQIAACGDKLTELTIVQEILAGRDLLPKISCWVWGGDGWAYDIGFGGLDHVLASKTNLNVLVMDTEGYSNTGGQVSKSTNFGAVQKFAPTGYRRAKKDLGAIAMAYEDVYVASIAIGADYTQSVKALTEAESFNGASLILCYSPCIEHKILFPRGLSRLAEEMKKAVDAGYWTLYRFNPSYLHATDPTAPPPFILDSKRLSMSMGEFTKLENRFQILYRTHPEVAAGLSEQLQTWADERIDRLKWLEERYKPKLLGAEGSTPLSILVGSDTGTTTELSVRMADLCRDRNFNVTLLDLDEVSPEMLQSMENVVIMCSTAGEGDMPATAHSFWENISAAELPADYLANTNISVFGLGDTGYRHFNQAAKDIQSRLVALGAKESIPLGLGNDKDDDKYETAFSAWLPEFWKFQNAPESEAEKHIPETIIKMEPVANPDQVRYLPIQPPKTKMLTLEKNVRITPSDYNRCIRHLVFDVEGKDFSYLLGDALTVYPDNDPAKIIEFLEWYGADTKTVFEISGLKKLDPRRAASFKHPMTTTQLFNEVVDILGRPNKNFYKQLRKFATESGDIAALDAILDESAEGAAKYAEMTAETVTYAEVLQKFPSAKPSVEHLVSLIPCIKPRLYSIASSQRLVNDKVELVIVILDWKTPSGKVQRGLSTNYIDRIATDRLGAKATYEVPCSVTPGTFKFPTSLMQPYVMTGLGTGLAPFRAFIQERAYFKRKGEECGPMWLFYGCRYKAKDYIFGDELEAYHKEGVLTELRPAFSRDQKEKIYVQHRMREVKDRLYEDLIAKNGYFYLCGQAGQLERDVRSALTDAFANGQLSAEEASKKFEEFDASGRYCTELY